MTFVFSDNIPSEHSPMINDLVQSLHTTNKGIVIAIREQNDDIRCYYCNCTYHSMRMIAGAINDKAIITLIKENKEYLENED